MIDENTLKAAMAEKLKLEMQNGAAREAAKFQQQQREEKLKLETQNCSISALEAENIAASKKYSGYEPLNISSGANLAAAQQNWHPKTWTECSDSEKIDRLKFELDSWRRVCADMRDRLQLFEFHHHVEGKLMIPLDAADRARIMAQCSQSNNFLA